MQEFIDVYKKHKEEIEQFLITTLRHQGDLSGEERENYKKVFATFPSMELIYVTDSAFCQTSANIFKHREDETAKGENRAYMHHKLMKKDELFSLSSPYISSATGHTCITLMKKEGEENIFIDFELSALLGRLGLVELNPAFNNFTKLFYKLAGFSLISFAFMAVGFSLVSYGKHIIVDQTFSLETLFKPIVALTLGLAIFDLAKTILEREVFFKNFARKDEDTNVLAKFSIAIIIALSIEALMVVFKIALHDYTQMVHALYLIIGIALIVLSLGVYSYLAGRSRRG